MKKNLSLKKLKSNQKNKEKKLSKRRGRDLRIANVNDWKN